MTCDDFSRDLPDWRTGSPTPDRRARQYRVRPPDGYSAYEQFPTHGACWLRIPVSPCAACHESLIYNRMVVDRALSDLELDSIFHALADATRRDILNRTIRDAESVSALSRHYSMSLPAVQKHVAALERATLVTKQRRGREQIVRANGATIAKAIALLDQYEALWIDRADAIADVLATEKGERS